MTCRGIGMKKGLRTKKRRTKVKTLRNKKILLTIIIIIFSFFLIFSKFSTASTVILGAGVNITDGTIIRLTGLNCSMTVINELIVDKLEVYSNFLLITSSITAPTYILNLPYNYSPATNVTNITGIPNATVDLTVNASTFGNGIKIYSVSPSAYLTSVSWSNNNNFSLTVNASSRTNSTVNVYWPYSFSPTGISCKNCAAYSSSFNSTTDIVTLIANHSSPVTWDLYTSDVTPPTWSSNQSSTPATYSSTPSRFNITWNDDAGIDKVYITIRNSTGVLINNASMSNATYGGSIYNYSLALPAGTFNWTSYANDTSNNWNASATWVFTIGNGTVPLVLSNNTSLVGTYPYSTNITGSGCPSQITCNLYRNNSAVSNPDNQLLGAGVYAYVYNTTGNANYSTNSTSTVLTITQGSQSISLTGITNGTYPYSVTPVCTGNVTSNLYRNNSAAANNTAIQLGAGTYNWTCNTTTNANYTFNTISVIQVVSQGSNPVNLYLNGTLNANKTYTYPNAINATGTSSVLTPSLYRDEVSKGTNEQILLGNGTYAYKVNATGNANYSDNATGVTYYVLVNKGIPTITALINGSTSDAGYPQYNIFNLTGTINTTYNVNITLSLNATGYGNDYNWSVAKSTTNITNLTAVGTFLFNASFYGDANWTAVSDWSTLSISAASSPAYSNLKTSQTSPLQYAPGLAYQFNSTWTDTAGISNVVFEWNGTTNYTYLGSQVLKSGSEYYYTYPSDLTPGTYSYAWYANNTNNNWTKTTVQPYIVNKSSATLSLTVSPSNATTYPTSTIANGSVLTGDPVGKYNISLYRNGILVSSTASASFTTESTTLGAGIWNYTLVYNGTQNYSSTTITNITNINKGTMSLSITGSNATYPASVSISGTRGSNSGDADVNYTLWRDNALVSSGNGTSGNLLDTNQLGVGSYAYTYNATGGVNWTANSTGVALNVNVGQGTPPLTISINPSANVNYPTTTTVIGSGCPTQGASDVNCTLWGNGVLVSSAIASDPSSDVKQLPAGTYVYSYNATGGFNWTSASTQATLTVNSGGGGGPGNSGGPSGPGGGTTLYSLNLSNVPNLIEINQNSSKTTCFSLKNIGNAAIQNISIRLYGIAINWFTISPNFVGYLNETDNVSVCISFAIPEDAAAKDYQININASSKAIKSVSTTLRILAKASLPQCPSCPECLNWTSCVNNSQTRTCYKCDETTNYACVENTENESCETSTPLENGTAVYIIALIASIAVAAIVIIAFVRRKKVRKVGTEEKVEYVYRKEDFEKGNTP